MKNNRFKKPGMFVALLLGIFIFQLTACEDRVSPKPDPDPVGQIPEEPDPVGNDTTDVPEPPAGQPGQDSAIGKPVELYGRLRMQWAPTDYREAFYEAKGLPLRVVQENQYIQGSDVTNKISYDFIYDAQSRLKQLNQDNGTYVNYIYEGEKVIETREFAKSNLLFMTRTYTYSGEKLAQIHQVNNYKKVETLLRFYYDKNGNLTELRDYSQNKDTGAFNQYSSIRYFNYDAKLNVENLWTVYPFLPGVTFSKNNPGLKISYNFDGKVETEIPGRKTFSYQYSEKGYPISRNEKSSNGNLSTSYTYTGL